MNNDQSLHDQVAHLQGQGYSQEQIIAALNQSPPTQPTAVEPKGVHKRVDAITAIVVVGLFLIALAMTIIVSNQWSAISAWGRISLVLVPVIILYLIAAFTAPRPEQDSVHRGTLLMGTLLVPVLFGTAMVQLAVWPEFNETLFTWCSAVGWLLFYGLEWTWKRQSTAPLTLLMTTLTGIGLLVHYEPRGELIPWIVIAAGSAMVIVGKLYGRKLEIGLPRVIFGATAVILAFPIAVITQLDTLKVEWQFGAWIVALIGIIYWYLSRFISISTTEERWQTDINQLQLLMREGGWIIALISIFTLMSTEWWYLWLVMAVGVGASLLSLLIPVYSLVPIGGAGILISSFTTFNTAHGLWVPLVAAVIGLTLILSAIKIRIPTFIPLGTFIVTVSVLVISSEVFTDSVSWPISVLVLGLFFIGLGMMLNRITHLREGQLITYQPKVTWVTHPASDTTPRQGSCLRSCLFLVLAYLVFSFLLRLTMNF